MSAPSLQIPRPAARRGAVLRYSEWDAAPIALSLMHGTLLAELPGALVVAVGLWWSSNSVAHWFVHKPFFRSPVLNRLYSCYLSLLLGIPQTAWRQRHLAHHAGVPCRLRLSPLLAVESILVLALWSGLAVWRPSFFLTAYLPGFVAGLALCWLQGRYEHDRGTVSHYGWLYNRLFLNDGYHAEHHASPGRHWWELPSRVLVDVPVSRWPAVLRWLEAFSLDGLERLVLCCRPLQRFVLARHERAFRRLLPRVDRLERVGIVGGGLFPRTALVFRRLAPNARLVIIDRCRFHLDDARRFLGPEVELIHETYDPARHGDFDLVVFPLAYVGDRERLYQRPADHAVIVHDWLWRRAPLSAVVSWLLLKRINLVPQTETPS